MTPEPPTLDQWTFVDYKDPGGNIATAASWMPADDRRRLNAYHAYAAYVRNAARSLIRDDQVGDRREYGEPAAFVAEIVAGLLGEEPTIEADERVRGWLNEWATLEGLISKLLIADDKAVTLGDAVFLVTWDEAKGRPSLSVVDPGFYFPTLSDDGAWPEEVRIAWEVDDDNGDRWVHVRRWELVDLIDPATGQLVERAYPWGKSTKTVLFWDARWPLDSIRNRGGRDGWARLDDRYAVPESIRVDGELVPAWAIDIGVDFLPVVHIPNTLVGDDEHFGASSLGRVLQALDELAAGDTDLATSASLVAYPPLATESGVTQVNQTIRSYGPGTVFSGKLTALDTSRSLDAGVKFVEAIRDRVAVNGQVPQFALEQAIGGGGEVSGYALKLRRRTYEALIQQMRLARAPKWRLLLKFATRWAMLGKVDGVPVTEEPLSADIVPSPVLPVDAAGEVERLVGLVKAGLLSRETAVPLILEALGIQADAAEELGRIQAADFAGANELIDATGDVAAGRTYLGLPAASAQLP